MDNRDHAAVTTLPCERRAAGTRVSDLGTKIAHVGTPIAWVAAAGNGDAAAGAGRPGPPVRTARRAARPVACRGRLRAGATQEKFVPVP